MKKKRKILGVALSAAALMAASVFGTMAYLTDTEAVTNTFTVGKVQITLDEAKVNEMGKPDGTTRWQPTEEDPAQEYRLIPGHEYTKDPTVTVGAGSEESYVRMMVEVNFEQALTDAQLATSLDGIFLGYDASKWAREDKTVSNDMKTITYEYRYYTTVDGKNADNEAVAQPLEPLFTSIAVPGTFDNDDIAFLDGMNISVEAHAIQADGFENADAAWVAFDKQHQ